MIIYSVIVFAVSAVFFFIGRSIFHGRIDLIHDYHRKKIKDADKAAYGKAIGKALLVISASLFLSGTAALFGDSGPFVAVSMSILFAGLAAALILIIKAQKQYNGGVF